MCVCMCACFILYYHIYSKLPWVDTVYVQHRCCCEHFSNILRTIFNLFPQNWSFTHCTWYGTTRNLGVLFDSTCCLNGHVNKICQNINYQLYSIGKIWKYLDKTTTEKNYKFGSDTPSGLLQQPSVCYQWIFSVSATTLLEQCCAQCLLALKIWPYNTSTERSTLAESWAQNKFKILLSLQGSTRHCSTLLVITMVPYKPGRSLRSEGKHLLTTPRYHLEGFGKSCFVHATSSPSPPSVPSPFTLSRVVWRHICLMLHIHTVWCLSDIISAFGMATCRCWN